MGNQLIISLGREFGSGGHEIARRLAERFDLPLLEDNILRKIAEENGMDADAAKFYDEKPRLHVLYRTVNGFNNSPESAVMHMQFQYLKKIAEEGKSFLIVGRCAEEILRDYEGMISIFVLADTDFKIQRIMAREDISEDEAMILMDHKNRKRKIYHNQYCKGKWGDSRNYEISINSSKLGIEGTTDLLENYIRERIKTGNISFK